MTYRDDVALRARIARLEGAQLHVRARANRIRRRKVQRRLRAGAWLCAGVLVLGAIYVLLRPACSCLGAEAKAEQAMVDAKGVRAVAAQWRVAHASDGCPSFASLVRAGELSSGGSDPWQHGYEIRCDGDSVVTVASAGPDGRFGTADDIVAAQSP